MFSIGELVLYCCLMAVVGIGICAYLMGNATEATEVVTPIEISCVDCTVRDLTIDQLKVVTGLLVVHSKINELRIDYLENRLKPRKEKK
jgi:hypothetical protein